jgi:hypothetical protein
LSFSTVKAKTTHTGITNMITDELIVMEAPELMGEPSKDEVIGFILGRRLEIESIFPNNEYLKLDLTHGELLGLKSTAVIDGVPISDLTAISWVIRHTEKYKDADIINLGNVEMLYEKLG